MKEAGDDGVADDVRALEVAEEAQKRGETFDDGKTSRRERKEVILTDAPLLYELREGALEDGVRDGGRHGHPLHHPPAESSLSHAVRRREHGGEQSHSATASAVIPFDAK